MHPRLILITRPFLTGEEELGNNVYVNLSSGTAEYIAAASICQMMFDNATLFTAAKNHSRMTTDFSKLLRTGRWTGSRFASGGIVRTCRKM